MSKSLRITFIAVIVALAAGWFGLRHQNSKLEKATLASAPVAAGEAQP